MQFDIKKLFSNIKTTTKEQPKKVVGIDMGSSSIKVVEVELRNDVLTLTTYGELQLGPYADGAMGNVVTLSADKRIEALVDVMRESGVTAKNGVLALPLSNSFVTVITIQAQANEDISSRVHVEARKYIPVPLNEVALEWTEISGPAEASTADAAGELTHEVLLAAIQNDALQEMKTLLESTEMTSNPSEIELFSTLRAVTKETDVSIGVIDVGADVTKLYISQDGFLQRIHRVHAGGAQATQAIAKELSISFEEAENVKRNYSPEQPHAPVVKKIMSSTFERALQEFKRVIGQYELKSGTPLSRIVLTGGSATFTDFQSDAQYAFDREVELTNPFNKVAYPAFMEDTLTDIAPIFAVALGAALRSFEL